VVEAHDLTEATAPADGVSPASGRRECTYDAEGVRRAIHDLLIAIGENPERDGLRDTPERVSRAYREMFAGLWQEPEEVLTTTF
jgi:GTP cyclohydrolase I